MHQSSQMSAWYSHASKCIQTQRPWRITSSAKYASTLSRRQESARNARLPFAASASRTGFSLSNAISISGLARVLVVLWDAKALILLRSIDLPTKSWSNWSSLACSMDARKSQTTMPLSSIKSTADSEESGASVVKYTCKTRYQSMQSFAISQR